MAENGVIAARSNPPTRGRRGRLVLVVGLLALVAAAVLAVWSFRDESRPLTPTSYTVSSNGITLTVYLLVPAGGDLSARSVHARVSGQSPRQVAVEAWLDVPRSTQVGPASALIQAVDVPLDAPLGQARVVNSEGAPIRYGDTRTQAQLR